MVGLGVEPAGASPIGGRVDLEVVAGAADAAARGLQVDPDRDDVRRRVRVAVEDRAGAGDETASVVFVASFWRAVDLADPQVAGRLVQVDAERGVGVEHARLRTGQRSRLVSRKSSSVPIEPVSAIRSMLTASTSCGSVTLVTTSAVSPSRMLTAAVSFTVRARADEPDTHVADDLLELHLPSTLTSSQPARRGPRGS